MNSLRSYLETIKVEHTLFALPFAYATLFLVAGGWPDVHDLAWITVAMAGGRTVGMGLNRILDARVDARNPRTATRAIPAGRLSSAKAMAFTAAAGVLFVAAVFLLHPVCRWLWPLPLAAMTVYPYAKRFTPFAHLVLGLVYFMIPGAVWLAVSGEAPPVAIALGIAAALWVAGFDIIYACQDAGVDRDEGLHSIPADFGIPAGLRVARGLHAGFLAALFVVARMVHAGGWFYAGVALATIAIVYEHRLVSPRDLSRVNAAFFTANGILSVVLFVLIALDTVM
jgi:4-hydroxybenzoate polyprenyltransferase